MKRILVRPRSTEDVPRRIERRDIVRALANVLAWAGFQNVVGVTLTTDQAPSFAFTYIDGTTSHHCENVPEPPAELKPLLLEGTLRAISSNKIGFWLNRIRIKYFGYECHAELEVLVTEGDSIWTLKLASGKLTAQRIISKDKSKTGN